MLALTIWCNACFVYVCAVEDGAEECVGETGSVVCRRSVSIRWKSLFWVPNSQTYIRLIRNRNIHRTIDWKTFLSCTTSSGPAFSKGQVGKFHFVWSWLMWNSHFHPTVQRQLLLCHCILCVTTPRFCRPTECSKLCPFMQEEYWLWKLSLNLRSWAAPLRFERLLKSIFYCKSTNKITFTINL